MMETIENSREFEFIRGLTAELSSKELIFPTSLNATMKIRHALNDANISNDNVARIVGAEPVLSAQILRLSNSVAKNPSGKRISDLKAATMLLGFATVRSTAITVGMKQLMEHKSSGKSSQIIEGLWNRSLRVAVMSQVIAANLSKLSPDKAMVAGLLHDIGKFYILNRAHHYQDLFVSEKTIWELVDQWHANIGAAILENWEIDDDIRVAVMDHLSSDMTLSNKPSLTDVVAAANFLDAHFIEDNLSQVDWKTIPAALKNLHFDLEKCGMLLVETKTELDSIIAAIS